MKPELAYRFAEVIGSLTDEGRVRALVDAIYTKASAEDRDRMAKAVAEDFGELDAKVKAGSAGVQQPGDALYFLDDPPTAVFVTACQEAGLSMNFLPHGTHVNACDDGRLWINGAVLGDDARKYVPERKRAVGE